MPAGPIIARRLREALWLACLACWALGAGLLLWGLAPVILAAVTRATPRWETLAASGVVDARS